MAEFEDLFVGVDLGTGGVRAVAADRNGDLVARASTSLSSDVAHSTVPDGHVQDPRLWWEAFVAATRTLIADLQQTGIRPTRIRAISIDGTSGTITCVDTEGQPLRPALMYNDRRSQQQAAALNEMAGSFCDRLGYRFDASYALAKILWIREREPELFARTNFFAHHADFVQWQLTGEAGITDYSNSLKTGYDLVNERWPDWLDVLDGVPERLPKVVPPARAIGTVCDSASQETGFAAGTVVVSGATDGTAGSLAAGLHRIGDYSTTLGTTLIFKSLSPRLVKHPDGLVYSHKLPGGRWLPGAASNTGGQWMAEQFTGADPVALDAAARSLLPSPHIAYPLVGTGERFPFRVDHARGFVPSPSTPDPESYAACLQGTALLERLCYEVLDRVVEISGGDVFATGGGSRSAVWMQCRADVTGRWYHRTRHPEAAFGAAIIAAAGSFYDNLTDSVESMVQVERNFEPVSDAHATYEEIYQQFLEELRQRGYL